MSWLLNWKRLQERCVCKHRAWCCGRCAGNGDGRCSGKKSCFCKGLKCGCRLADRNRGAVGCRSCCKRGRSAQRGTIDRKRRHLGRQALRSTPGVMFKSKVRKGETRLEQDRDNQCNRMIRRTEDKRQNRQIRRYDSVAFIIEKRYVGRASMQTTNKLIQCHDACETWVHFR